MDTPLYRRVGDLNPKDRRDTINETVARSGGTALNPKAKADLTNGNPRESSGLCLNPNAHQSG